MASSERTDEAASASAAAATTTGTRSGEWHQRGTAAHSSSINDLAHLRFEATVNGRYHTSRQGWYEFMHRWCMFVVVIGGAGAVAEAVGPHKSYSWLIALIPTIAGTIDLVFDFSAKAALHARLQEKCYEII